MGLMPVLRPGIADYFLLFKGTFVALKGLRAFEGVAEAKKS
jgi:hypothetical protein